jgi:Fungal N-terminal domain of STAND proteins
MDPFSVTTACVRLIASVAHLSLQINSFVDIVQTARSDMNDVLQKLDSLSISLKALRDGGIESRFPPPMLETLLTVLGCCDNVVQDMRALLRKLSSSHIARLRWTVSGQDDMTKFRTSLESYKSTITISLQIGHM